MKNKLYKILGIKQTATKSEIKKAYKQKAKQFHPDVVENKTEEFLEVGRAYGILICDEKREEYDKYGSVNEKIDTEYAQALQNISKLFMEAVAENRNYKYEDYISIMKNKINQQISKEKSNKDNANKNLKYFKGIKKRVKKGKNKTAYEIIINTLENEISFLEQLKIRIKTKNKVYSIMLDLLKGVNYKFDERMENDVQMGFMNQFNTPMTYTNVGSI